MPALNITDAAKLAGITRQHLHTHYIKQGLISVSRDERNRPTIDTSELLRVFGQLKQVDTDDKHDSTPTDTENAGKTAELTAKIEALQEQLREARDREKWYQEQIAGFRLLEHQQQPKGLFARLFGR